MKKVTFKDGGHIVCQEETAKEMELDENYLSTQDATFKEIREYQEHQKFQKFAEKYMNIIEDFNADRPGLDVRFRYDRHDILNLIVLLVKKEKPQIKRVQK